MKQINFISAIHGDEYMPTLALASINVAQVIGNPRALALRKRYVEKDLNASFGTKGELYEERRAKELGKILDPHNLVLDFHTFSVESEPFVIIVDLKMLSLARLLGLKHIVYMKHNIKGGHALINHYSGVSVEVGRHDQPESFDRTIEIVKRLSRNKNKSGKAQIYEVYDRIKKRGNYINFKKTDEFTPILYGERAYDELGFYGLAAREITGTI